MSDPTTTTDFPSFIAWLIARVRLAVRPPVRDTDRSVPFTLHRFVGGVWVTEVI